MEANIKQQIDILLLQLGNNDYYTSREIISTLVGLKAYSVPQLQQAAREGANIRIRYGAQQALKVIANSN